MCAERVCDRVCDLDAGNAAITGQQRACLFRADRAADADAEVSSFVANRAYLGADTATELLILSIA